MARSARFILIIASAAALAACSRHNAEPAGASNTLSVTSGAVSTAEATPTPPSHRYTAREGEDYGYVAAVSDDDRKAGASAGDVTMYRYLGQSDGVYTLALTDKPDALIQCTNPCQIVKVTLDGQVIKRVAYTDDSVIGSAFQDAFNGQLAVYGAAAAKAQADALKTAVYTSDIPTKMPTAYRMWRTEVPQALADDDYVTKLQGVASPMQTVTVAGQPMLFGTSCMPHDCGANLMGVLVGPKGHIVAVNYATDGDNASPTLIGDPSPEETACIKAMTQDEAKSCA